MSRPVRRFRSLLASMWLLLTDERGRSLVAAERHRLRPGIYVNTGRWLWRRVGSQPPSHLVATKGRKPLGAGWTSWRPSWLKEAAYRLLVGVVPRVVRVSREVGDEAGFPFAVVASDGGLVLLDPSTGRVGRSFGHGPVTPSEVAIREEWSRSVPAPSFNVIEGGRWILEEFVWGDRFGDLSPHAKRDALTRLFRAYEVLARASATGDSSAHLDAARAPRIVRQAPDAARPYVEDGDLLDELSTGPLVPTPLDIWKDNLVRASDGAIVLIDLHPFGYRPFFAPPIGAIPRLARVDPSLVWGYLHGDFDGALQGLFAAVGLPVDPGPRLRRSLLALSVILTTPGEWHANRWGSPVAFSGDIGHEFRSVGLHGPAIWLPDM